LQSLPVLRAEPKALGKGPQAGAEALTCHWHKPTNKTERKKRGQCGLAGEEDN